MLAKGKYYLSRGSDLDDMSEDGRLSPTNENSNANRSQGIEEEKWTQHQN